MAAFAACLAHASVVLAALPASAASPSPSPVQTWNFDVRLDGRPIGSHRFVVEGPPEANRVQSQARFNVTLLGLTVYRYRHEAQERWRGDCLQQLRSRTDDDGQPVEVDRRLEALADSANSAGCLMSYAYWHPGLLRQQRLLNPQTGEVDPVRIERLPDAPLPGDPSVTVASRWRITATSSTGTQVLTLWRDAPEGRWIGLDAQVKGGRLLTYRLAPTRSGASGDAHAR